MYKSIMKYLTDKDLSLNAKGFLSMILFNDEINALELSKGFSNVSFGVKYNKHMIQVQNSNGFKNYVSESNNFCRNYLR